MDSSQNSNKFSDFNSFEIMKNYEEKYIKHINSSNNIYNSQEHKDFREKVEKPFNDFCNLIYQQIPKEIAFYNSRTLTKVEAGQFVFSQKFRLYRYLDIFSILYIEMTERGIKIGFIYETGEILAKKIGEINPLIMSKIVAKDIHIFRDFCDIDDNSYFWEKITF